MKDSTTATIDFWRTRSKAQRESALFKGTQRKAERALQVFSWNKCAMPGCTTAPRNNPNAKNKGAKYLYCSQHRKSGTYNDVKGNINVIIEEKFEELQKYLYNKCYAWRADYSRFDDIVQSTVERLLIENETKAFEDSRTLWGRATNIVKEEIAQTFADRLPVSGVKHQAHWTATKALQGADGDPKAAYHAQTGTSRVGRELIFAVAHGPSLYSPEYLQDLDPEEREDKSSLTSQDEDNIRVAIAELSEIEQKVVHLRMWLRLTNKQAAEELGLSTDRVRKVWQGAVRKLRPTLMVSLEHRGYADDES